MTTDPHSLALQKLQYLETADEMRAALPHLYGWPWYKWARRFFESSNRMNLICAANQISKSSTMIRKSIHWATGTELWPKLWVRPPLNFIYGYPTRDVATVEFERKWIPEFMPKAQLKDHPTYGWKPVYKAGQILAIDWNAGPTTHFKTYAQDVQDLQTMTSWANFIDEELPEELYSELQFRLSATDGYWHGVFTPTLGLELWRCAMEERGRYEKFKGALKMQVSMYDCLFYEDGTPSTWTKEKIQRQINSCKSDQEVKRRVFGRFVIDDGLKYPAFVRTKHFDGKKHHPVPKDWLLYIGADPGSGGDNHPAAVCCIAVKPDYSAGRIIAGWRGDGIISTAADVVKKCAQFRDEIDLQCAAIKYDFACRDFYTIAQEMGLDVEPAEKSHLVGEQVINVLFRNDMLYVYDLPELEPLAVELSSLRLSTPKNKAKDDFADAMRYALTAIPWDWSVINGKKPSEQKKEPTERDLRRQLALGGETEMHDVEDEIEAYNELMSGGTFSEDGFEFDL